MAASARFDPVTLEVLWTRLISIVDEAAAALVRTSFSTVVRESNDFACVLTDARGYSLVQATDSIPSFIGTVPRTIREILKEYPPQTLAVGDVLATNDIWLGTGHLPDITVAKPIFRNGALVGFAGTVAHAPDIGGRIRSADSREVFEEGLQIPPLKVVHAGTPDETFLRMLRKNVRVPDLVVGDLFAQFAALDLMERRVLGLMDEQALSDLAGLAEEIQGRSEQAMRKAIRALPDGVYQHETITDGFERPIRLRLALTVKDDAIDIDYAGTDPQVGRAINVAMCYTYAYTAYGVKAALCPGVPNNEGALRPIAVRAPLGSILNSRPPAAGGARAVVGHFLPMMVLLALARAFPERVIAGVGSPLWCLNYAGVDAAGKSIAGMFFINGGYGASAVRDGANVLSWPSNISSTPIEMIEQLAPFKFLHRRLRTGTGGNGRHRGGLGQELLLESCATGPLTISFLAERTRPEAAAPGIAGGGPGAPGAVLIDGAPVDPKRQHVVAPGARIELRTPGGGGYGPAAERSPAAREADRIDGYTAHTGV
ncbi:MAG: hydantoinase B/oxoprolinase family protein [Burkholderiales bacterium]|nr:hydantoinase B/oxoprolinase family protein [Burkholderiales bacterium]